MSTKMLRVPWLMNKRFIWLANGVQTTKSPQCREKETPHSGSTVDRADVGRHAKLMDQWWDVNGPMKALHSYNSVRVPFIRDGLVNPAGGKRSLYPLQGLKILDVGCGGGILSEPLAILGAKVTGIDASPELVKLAKEHTRISDKLSSNMPRYICTSMEEHAPTNENVYDAVVASEIIEHVNNKPLFVKACVKSLKAGGRIFFTTPNRTTVANLFVINAAEYLFRVVPKGTHEIEKFTTPTELSFLLERNECQVEMIHGLFYNLLSNSWSWTKFQHFVFALQAVKLDKDGRHGHADCS